MSIDLDFSDLTPRTVSVAVGGQRYVLLEATADAVLRYRDVCSRASRVEQSGEVSVRFVEGLASAESLVVSLCLAKADKDGQMLRNGDGTPMLVPESVVRGWPNKVLSALYDQLCLISTGIGPDTEEQLVATQQWVEQKLKAVRGRSAAEKK